MVKFSSIQIHINKFYPLAGGFTILETHLENHPHIRSIVFVFRLVRLYRCKIQGGVRGNTNIVIAKDVNAKSSKLDKARELGIKIVSYANAKKLLEN